MAKPVPHSTDIAPGKLWEPLFGNRTQADGRLAYDLKFPFDGGNGFRIFPKAFEVHSSRKLFDHSDRFDNVAQGSVRVFKRQARPRAPRVPGWNLSASGPGPSPPLHRADPPAGFQVHAIEKGELP